MSASPTLPRRAFLFGRPTIEAPVFRPPWALSEDIFAQTCTRCDACVHQCPEHVLARGCDGLPRFLAGSGECTFCRACVDACDSGALDPRQTSPWNHRVSVDGACLAARGVVCSSCRDICPEAAIALPPAARGGAMIDPALCTGCGACVAVCPANAISLQNQPSQVSA
jgi:ferredoxin-type protein NapF